MNKEAFQYLQAKADFDSHAEGCQICGDKERSTHTLCDVGGKLHGVVHAFAQAYIGRPLPVLAPELTHAYALETARELWKLAMQHYHADTADGAREEFLAAYLIERFK